MTVNNTFEPNDFYHRTTYSEDRKTVSDSLNAISAKYLVTRVSKSQETKIYKNILSFDSFKVYKQLFLINAFELSEGNHKSHISIVSINSLVETVYRHQIRRENLTEWEFVGLTTLKKDYGRVYIRPENISDKINELFNKVEVDFAIDKEFSRKYYCLTSDDQKLRNQVTIAFLLAIRKHHELEIEIIGRILMVRLCRRISVKSAQTIADFLMEKNDGVN